MLESEFLDCGYDEKVEVSPAATEVGEDYSLWYSITLFVEDESIIFRECQLWSGGTSVRKRTSSLSEVTLLRSWKPANSAKHFYINTWSTSTLSSTRLNRSVIGPILPRGIEYAKKRVQLRRSLKGIRLCLLDRKHPHLMENLCQQGNGMVAVDYCSSSLSMDWSDVVLAYLSLLQKHNKKIFDMCNIGEEFHLGLKRNEILRECNRILDREDFWNQWSLNNPFTATY